MKDRDKRPSPCPLPQGEGKTLKHHRPNHSPLTIHYSLVSMPNITPSLAITWRQPTFLLPLFCLCTLLGVSNSLASAIGLALAIIVAVSLSVLAIALLNSFFPEDIGVVSWILLGSAIVAVIELLMHAWFYGLYRVAGL